MSQKTEAIQTQEKNLETQKQPLKEQSQQRQQARLLELVLGLI
jgi:hypothetical protein